VEIMNCARASSALAHGLRELFIVSQNLEALLAELLKQLEQLPRQVSTTALPSALTKKHAARELSIGITKLKAMVRSGAIATCDVGGKQQIPRSEILRLTTPNGKRAKISRAQSPDMSRAAQIRALSKKSVGTTPKEKAAAIRDLTKRH
jgi:hypothetical protein